MFSWWKVPHITKGLLTNAPLLNGVRRRRISTGGSDSARYCYSVWLRHLTTLASFGFSIRGAKVGEIGPGDSIGCGLAALLSGAKSYIGLDVVPFSYKADLVPMFDELCQMFARAEPIPGDIEFPRVRPKLDSYSFPGELVDCADLASKSAAIGGELQKTRTGEFVTYIAPWFPCARVAPSSLDAIFSQAVLEHVDDLEATYNGMASWLKPGGYCSHVIDFSAHWLSPFSNGHWAYSDWQWQLVRGRREYLLNRQPLSVHVAFAVKAGLEILGVEKDYTDNGLDKSDLSNRFQELTAEDLRTRGAVIVVRKPL